MRSAVEALGRSPEAEIVPQHDKPQPPANWGLNDKWGDPSKRPAIGAGWGRTE
jgi:hypothetical protein